MTPDSFASPRPQPQLPPALPPTGFAALISQLDAITPFVQAIDFLLMLIAGIACLRARKTPGLLLLAIACFLSAVILLGFFWFGISHGAGGLGGLAYLVARLLAPFEMVLFATAIVVVARRSR